MKKTKPDAELRERLAEAGALALRYRMEAEWLARQLTRRGAKPVTEMCQYVPERDCSNCGEDLPDCWLVAAGSEVDAMVNASPKLAKEATA